MLSPRNPVCIRPKSNMSDVWASLIRCGTLFNVRNRFKVLIELRGRTEEEKGKAILSLSNSNLYWPKKSLNIIFVLQKYTKDNVWPLNQPPFFLNLDWKMPRMIKTVLLHNIYFFKYIYRYMYLYMALIEANMSFTLTLKYHNLYIAK